MQRRACNTLRRDNCCSSSVKNVTGQHYAWIST